MFCDQEDLKAGSDMCKALIEGLKEVADAKAAFLLRLGYADAQSIPKNQRKRVIAAWPTSTERASIKGI